MFTKLLDVTAFSLILAAGYISLNTTDPYELTHYFLAILGIVICTLSALIKDNYVDLFHVVVGALIWYTVGLFWSVGYLLLVATFRRVPKIQLLVASSYCIGMLLH